MVREYGTPQRRSTYETLVWTSQTIMSIINLDELPFVDRLTVLFHKHALSGENDMRRNRYKTLVLFVLMAALFAVLFAHFDAMTTNVDVIVASTADPRYNGQTCLPIGEFTSSGSSIDPVGSGYDLDYAVTVQLVFERITSFDECKRKGKNLLLGLLEWSNPPTFGIPIPSDSCENVQKSYLLGGFKSFACITKKLIATDTEYVTFGDGSAAALQSGLNHLDSLFGSTFCSGQVSSFTSGLNSSHTYRFAYSLSVKVQNHTDDTIEFIPIVSTAHDTMEHFAGELVAYDSGQNEVRRSLCGPIFNEYPVWSAASSVIEREWNFLFHDSITTLNQRFASTPAGVPVWSQLCGAWGALVAPFHCVGSMKTNSRLQCIGLAFSIIGPALPLLVLAINLVLRLVWPRKRVDAGPDATRRLLDTELSPK